MQADPRKALEILRGDLPWLRTAWRENRRCECGTCVLCAYRSLECLVTESEVQRT